MPVKIEMVQRMMTNVCCLNAGTPPNHFEKDAIHRSSRSEEVKSQMIGKNTIFKTRLMMEYRPFNEPPRNREDRSRKNPHAPFHPCWCTPLGLLFLLFLNFEDSI